VPRFAAITSIGWSTSNRSSGTFGRGPRERRTLPRCASVSTPPPPFDVGDLDIASSTLSGAVVLASQVVDFDLDQHDDIVLEVEVAEMDVYNPEVVLQGEDANGNVVVGGSVLVWVATAVDVDADGVHDACDDCPLVAGPPASADGCP
jgi:hypothetical protein